MGYTREELADWITVIVAARLGELSEDQETEINSILKYLSERISNGGQNKDE